MELERDCPACDNDSFWLTASTMVHLGEKRKYDCTECGYGLVTIGDAVDSAVA